MKKLLLLLLSFAIFGCSSVKVLYDYDKQVDFSKYKTYQFSEDSNKLGVGDLNRDRIFKAIETEMDAKGFSKADNPDVLVDLHIKSQQKTNATAYTTGYGGPWSYGYGGGFSTTQVSYNDYTEGTLFVNLVDNVSQKIVWQGTGSKTIDENANADKREETINYAVQLIFTNYPPEK